MHILYLHQYFVPPDGNGGTRSYEMARRLVKAGNRVTMITSSAFFPPCHAIQNGTTSLEIEGINIRVINVHYSNQFSYSKRLIAFILFAGKCVCESMKVKDVDIVFATSTPLSIAIPGIIAKRRHKTSLVFEVRDLWPEVPIAMGVLKNPMMIWAAKKMEKWAYRNSKQVIALSPGMSDGIRNVGYPAENISIIPNCCDVELFRVPESGGQNFLDNHPYLKTGPLIVYTGTLGAVNGVDYLIDIASHMMQIDPTVRFLIVGSGREMEYVLDRAVNLGVFEKNLWFLPPVSKTDMPNILSASTVATSFVIDLPALWNNSANKFFDTLAGGRPMVINHEGWQADILRKNGAGLVLPPDDSLTAARQLHAFLSDDQRLMDARKAATLLSDTEFNRDQLFGKFLDVFESVQQKIPESPPHKAAY